VPSAFLHPFAKPTKDAFIPLVRGEGARVWDASGRDYVDGMASLWYCAVGHGRREIADAVRDQIATLESYSTFDPFTSEPVERLAERLRGLTPMPHARAFFCGSGSEAVDTAMKLARLAHVQAGRPERTLIVSRMRGYHGTNYGGTSAQGLPLNKAGWGPLVPDVVQVDGDDLEALSVVMSRESGRIAAVLAEPVQGAGGVYPPAPGYLEGLRRLCDRHGAYLIFDEVITGFGRLGHWFASQRYGVVPDLTCFAKAVTSGYQPLGGVLVGRAVREPLEADPAFILRHGYTYSGHAAACVAALVNLDIIEREGLRGRALAIGARIDAALSALVADGVIASRRGDGAVWAAGLHQGQDNVRIRDRMLELGGITRAINADTNTFCPPLVITDAELDRLLDAFATAAAGR
jgi:adenosylmethionine-8-amino-7-oxononanoate aminotransferase